MHRLFSSRVDYHMTRLGIFLLAAALVLGVTNCAPVQHTLIVRSTIGGSVAVPGEGDHFYGPGQVVELEAEADEGYRFVNWTGDVDTIVDVEAASTTITMSGDYSITANFVAVYDLSISSTDGGSANTPGEGTFTYDKGAVVNLVATRAIGYRFTRWTGDVSTVADVGAAATTITMNGDYSITANFVAVYDLSISSTAGGSVTTPGEGTFTYDAEVVVSLIAAADVGYRFVSWTGDVDSVADVGAVSTTITIDGHYSIGADFEAEEAVLFADANLEAAVREAIDVPERPIYPSDLKGLTYLDANKRGISDLTGLEHCIDLTELWLRGNQIRDVAPLADLTDLVSLSLGGNQVGDISPLANLTELTMLDLGGNGLSDIASLADMTGLTELWLDANQISDISLLANLLDLTHLDLNQNRISDISPLADLTNLTCLSLWTNQIGDVTPLANLTSITVLDLGDNGLSDIASLADMTGLTELWLDTNQIRDISPLANLANLTYLRLWGNQIHDVSPLANLTNLKELDLGVNQIGDISPLANLLDLTHLYLNENRISDMSPLADLTNLTWLALWNNQIGDVTPLANLTSITVLELGGNQISDIAPLVENEGLSEGDYVDLRWNPLSSDSTDMLIPQLQARGVKFNAEFPIVETCPCSLDTEWIQNPATGNYYALTSPMSWMAAEGCAQAWGGHLVTLNSWEEELWVKSTFGWHESFWIGFSVIGREHRAGHFVWSSGEPMIYTNWNLGEPNNTRGEDCAVMNAGDGWNDLSRHGHHRAVIEVSGKPG